LFSWPSDQTDREMPMNHRRFIHARGATSSVLPERMNTSGRCSWKQQPTQLVSQVAIRRCQQCA
jgi:hypothetical protein